MTVTVDVDSSGLHVRCTGADRWLCLSRGVDLSPNELTGARVVARAEAQAVLGIRVGGGYWPGRLTTGWFTVRGRKGARQLWAVYRDQEVLAVDTTRLRPCRVVLQHPDRAALAERIATLVAGAGA